MLKKIEIVSVLTGNTKLVGVGDTVYSTIDGHSARIHAFDGDTYVILADTQTGKPLPHYAHITQIRAF